MEASNYPHRYIARVILEAETPLFVGSGESSLLKDALVQKDHFGFPMIPGSSLTGVLRHALEKQGNFKDWNAFFGIQEKEEGMGSKVKISSAYLILNDGKIAEALSEDYSSILKYFDELPSRPHVRITHRGAAADKGLFENEIVYKGCRFLFELELKGEGKPQEEDQWKQLLNQLNSPLFRIGQGSRNGYGKLKVLSCKTKYFDLQDEQDFKHYLNLPVSFNAPCTVLQERENHQSTNDAITKYELQLSPDAYFLFGSGAGDQEVDATPSTELIVHYPDNQISFEEQTLIPASSIKGAIRHRTCFHYNRLKSRWAKKCHTPEHIEQWTGTNNEAILHLFGVSASDIEGQRGKVIINDQHCPNIINEKIFNHVAIDRFTGGAFEGALFSEKVSHTESIAIEIQIEEDPSIDTPMQIAFEESLIDICKGLLPLGGMTTKGHGIFTGSLIKNQEKIYNYADEL